MPTRALVRVAAPTFAALSLVLAFACQRDENRGGPIQQAPPGPSIGGGPIDEGDILRQIAQYRCRRLQACGEIGGGRRFQTQESCVSATHQAYPTVPQQCDVHGLDRKALARCTQALNAASCETLRETARLDECSLDVLCPGAP